MKFVSIAALCLAALLAGCATPQHPAQPAQPAQPGAPVSLAATAKSDRIMAAATLALVGTCEVNVAADYTALIMSRQHAALALTRGQISVQAASQVQALADSARAHLDAACPSSQATLDAQRLRSARTDLAAISQLLKAKP